MCAAVCPHGVFSIDGKKARITDRDLCMECGACAKNCPFGAISVRAGVGCAWAILISEIRGKAVPSCG
jgi:ferredoxin